LKPHDTTLNLASTGPKRPATTGMDKSGTSLIARTLRGEASSGKPSLARGFRIGSWTVTMPLSFQADTELLEYMCPENEKDFDRLVGK